MKASDMHQLLDDVIKLLPNGSPQERFLHAALVAEMAGKLAGAEAPAEKPAKRRTRRSRSWLEKRGFSYPTMTAAVADLVYAKGMTPAKAATALGIERKRVVACMLEAKDKGLIPATNGVSQ